MLACVGLLPEGPGGESTSRLIQVLGGIKFHVEVGLRPLFPCWMLAESHSQLLEAIHTSCHMTPFLDLQSKQQWVESFTCFESL